MSSSRSCTGQLWGRGQHRCSLQCVDRCNFFFCLFVRSVHTMNLLASCFWIGLSPPLYSPRVFQVGSVSTFRRRATQRKEVLFSLKDSTINHPKARSAVLRSSTEHEYSACLRRIPVTKPAQLHLELTQEEKKKSQLLPVLGSSYVIPKGGSLCLIHTEPNTTNTTSIILQYHLK